MTLDEFITNTKSDIEKFHAYCREEHKKDPESWPDDIGDVEWLEQFIIFLTHLETR